MAKFKFVGMDVYIKQMQNLDEHTTGIIKMAVYDGAAVVADEVRARLKENIKHPEKSTGELLDSMYLAKMKDENGYIYSEIGFAGYDSRGVPNIIKANVMESGSSKQRKTPFIRPAFQAANGRCISAMADTLDTEIKKLVEE